MLSYISPHRLNHGGAETQNFTENMDKIKYLVIFLLSLPAILIAQNQANVWYFGNKAGIDFNNSPPTPLVNGQMFTQEGCASISDQHGNLMFYSDGDSVWNRNHVAMPNGNNLLGNWTSTQSAIIIPRPLSMRYYYIFTSGASGLGTYNYTMVDMTLDNCNGDVVTTKKNIFLSDRTTEKQTAIRHGNGKDFWAIMHVTSTDTYKVFLITDTGVNATPVISKAGPVFQGFAWAGYLKGSHD